MRFSEKTQMNVSERKTNGRNSNALLWIVLAGLAIIGGGFLISLLTPYLFPAQGSTQAQQVDNLFRFMLVIGGAIFLLVQGVLAFSVIRFRAKPGDVSDGAAIHGNTTLEFVWTAIPAVIVLVITIYAYQVWQTTRAVQPNEQVVGTVGARFAWSFSTNVTPDQFPAGVELSQLDPAVQADIEEDGYITITSPQLHTYVGQPVQLQMVTQDVLHSFWVPAMRVKQDLLPGRTTDIRFTPVEAGMYRIVCAELCGSGHGNMAGTLVTTDDNPVYQGAWLNVHADEAAFRREFLEPETLAVLFPPEDPAARGRQLLASGAYPCNTCHVLSDLGWTGNLGPSLDGVGTRTQRLSQTGQPDMEAYIRNSIRRPTDFLVPGFGPLMPQFNPEPDQPNYMPEDHLNAIVAYLLTQTE